MGCCLVLEKYKGLRKWVEVRIGTSPVLDAFLVSHVFVTRVELLPVRFCPLPARDVKNAYSHGGSKLI